MLHRIVAASLQDVIETYDVTLNINIRVFNAVTHTGLSRKIDHNVKLVFGKEAVYQFTVGNAAFHELIVDACGLCLIQLAKAVLFE